MKKYSKIIGLLLAGLFILIDQLTKNLAVTYLKDGEPYSIIKGVFSLHYLENTGAAFGLFKDKILFFIIMTIVVLAVVLYTYYKLPESKRYQPLKYIMIFVMAGAMGNFIDRLLYNYVIDFFYFELINFPIFNLADCYVTISGLFLVILFIFYYKEEDFYFLTLKKDKEKTNE